MKKKIQKNKFLFKIGDNFKYFYAVREGSLKMYFKTSKGKEKIYGFKMSGNLIGFDAFKYYKHLTFCETLESSTICFIPYKKIELINYLSFNKHIMSFFSKEILRAYNLICLIIQKNSTKKIAFFLYKMSKRFFTRGFSKYEFRISMTKKDIGNYLNLSEETIDRVFENFRKIGIINFIGKHIQINSLKLLKELSFYIYR